MNMLINYRYATEQDLTKIKSLTDQMLEHTGLGVATVPKIRNLITGRNSKVLLAFDGDQLVGYTCGVLHENIFNDRLRVSDIGVFVIPEYRASKISKELIERLERWAKERGAQEIWLGQTTGENPENVVKYYNRLGYTTKGFNCVKEL